MAQQRNGGSHNVSHDVVVCDAGTGYVKCGFAGENFPTAVFPCMVGRPILRFEGSISEQKLDDIVVGEACAKFGHQLEVSHPICNGIVQDWEDMTHVWDHMIHHVLKIEPSECKILLSDPPLNPLSNREKLIEVMFETFNFESVFIQIQAVLSLYAQGLLTGLVVDSGDGVTHVVPVVDGFSFPHSTKQIKVAGRQITSYLIDLLLRRGYAFNQIADFENVREIKEQLCYVSYDYKREYQLGVETTILVKQYTLPDGRVIKVGGERFQAPEALFNPDLLDIDGEGLAETAFRCVQEMDIDNRMPLYQHIVLSGGNTMFPGLPSRLEKEMRQLYLQTVLRGNKQGLKKPDFIMPRPTHPYWKAHSILLGQSLGPQAGGAKSWRCKYCNETFSSTITRVIAHVSGIGGFGIGGCKCVPREVVDQVIKENGQMFRGKYLLDVRKRLREMMLFFVPLLRRVLWLHLDQLQKLKLRIEDPPRRKHMVYLGGSVLAGIIKNAPELWISQKEYEEEGFSCLQKCHQS